MAFVAMKLRKIDIAKRRAVEERALSRSRPMNFLNRERKEPLAPNPRNAILTTKKAK
jgi:hypothetical protein